MYLAGLIADPPRMTKAQLNKWVKGAYCYGIGCYTVAWVAAESRYGTELARAWIDSPKESIAAAGWSTWGSLVAITAGRGAGPGRDREAPRPRPGRDSRRPEPGEVHDERVRDRGRLLRLALAAKAKVVGKAVGMVEVDMGGTACRVPDVVAYIEKVERMGRQGKKRATARC